MLYEMLHKKGHKYITFRSEYHTQLAKMSFDEIFSQLECIFIFYNIYIAC